MKSFCRDSTTPFGFGHMIGMQFISSRVIWLVLSIMISSALDALFTLIFVANGGGEANPYAALLMTYGDTNFVGVKMAMTGAGTWVLAAFQQVAPAYLALHVLTILYLGLLGLHAVLWLFH